MIRLTVTTTLKSKSSSSSNIWFAFEADFKTLDDFYEALVEDGCVMGNRVHTKENSFGHREVTERTPNIIGLNAIATVSLCHFDYFDAPAGVQ